MKRPVEISFTDCIQSVLKHQIYNAMSFVHGYEGLASSYVSPLHYSNAGYHSSHHGHYISSVVQAPIEHHSHVVAPVEYAPPGPYVPMGLYTSRYHHKGGYQSSHHSVIDSGLYGSTFLSRKHLKRALKYGLYSAPHVGSFVHDVGHLGHYGASFVHLVGHSGHYGADMTFQRGDVYHYDTAAIPTAQAASPAVPLHAKSGIVAPPTAQDKVRFSQLLLVELATTLFHSPPSRFQAAAAARIKGQPSIHDAAESGNAGLVHDYIVADPAAVHAKDEKYVALCYF